MKSHLQQPGNLSDEALSLLKAGRDGGGPNPEQRARVRWGVQRRLAAGVGAASILGIAAWTPVAKAALVVSTMVVVGGIGYAVSTPGFEPIDRKETPVSSPAPAATPLPSPRTGGPPLRDESPAAKPASPETPDDVAPVEKLTIENPGVETSPSAVPRAHLRAPAAKAPPKSSASDLEAEVMALSAARRALRDGDPTSAARHLATYDQTVEGGALAEERAATEILVLCSQGQMARAKSRTVSFVKRWPTSPLKSRIDSACSNKSRPRAQSKSRAEESRQQ